MQKLLLQLATFALLATASLRADVIWNLVPFTGDLNVGMTVTVKDIGDSKILFDVVLDPNKNSGDITGLFFNVKGGVVGIDAEDFTGDDLVLPSKKNDPNPVCVVPGGTDTCGENNNNVNGQGSIVFPPNSFQLGFYFGEKNGDDGITSTSFIFNYAGTGRTFTESDFGPMAGRVQSTGDDGKGSSKLFTGTPEPPPNVEPVPEPSTMLLLSGGLLAAGLVRRRVRR